MELVSPETVLILPFYYWHIHQSCFNLEEFLGYNNILTLHFGNLLNPFLCVSMYFCIFWHLGTFFGYKITEQF